METTYTFFALGFVEYLALHGWEMWCKGNASMGGLERGTAAG